MSTPSQVSIINELADIFATRARAPEQTPNLFLTGRNLRDFLAQMPFSI